jgi:phosphoglucomutase
MNTHALSEPALTSAIEVLASNEVIVCLQPGLRYTPTPAISHAILKYNRNREEGFANGIVITPSHNPPEAGGFKYNPPHGGPAGSDLTGIIEDEANRILAEGLKEVRRISYRKALDADTTREYDFIQPYVEDLETIVDLKSIADSVLSIGVDPLGGAAVDFWDPIADRYRLNIEVVNRQVDPTFSFMTLDKDGKIRMDCSSPYAMARLIDIKDRFDIAFGNDTDVDRHGIVTRSSGLINPNHYLSVAIWYLFQNRPEWGQETAVGKTLVSTSMIDRVCRHLDRRLLEVPVGFKWFVDALIDSSCGFGGEESAGASFLRKDGMVWTTDKDGIVMGLMACEIMAKTGNDPAQIYEELENRFGRAFYTRLDIPASPEQKEALKKLTPDAIETKELAGEQIRSVLTHAPGNNSAIGGLKTVTENGWFAVRPSGTENINKMYAESFKGEKHLETILAEAENIAVNA